MLFIAILPITPDATTFRDMVAELLPLVFFGYVTMPMGVVCWTAIGYWDVDFITIDGIGE